MSTTSCIAVAGGTGRVGSKLVRHLVEADVPVRILTRDPTKAAELFPGLDVAEINLADQRTLTWALAGTDRLFVGLGSSPSQVEGEIALIDAAVSTGVAHLVKLSSMGGPSTLHPLDWHARIEAHLAGQPLGFTVLRPSTFVDVLALAGSAVRTDGWGGAAGDGRVNLIDTRDVAAVAAHELLHLKNATVQRSRHLTGGRTWSMPEIATALSALLGREIHYAQRTPAVHRAALIAGGLAPDRAEILVGLDRFFRDGAFNDTTATVRETLGRDPHSVTDWLRDHLDIFR